MSLDQLAGLGVGAFALMAIIYAWGAWRQVRRGSAVESAHRQRRRPLVGREAALGLCRDLVGDLGHSHPEAVAAARAQGVLPPELEEPIAKARRHFAERAPHAYRHLFDDAVIAPLIGRDTTARRQPPREENPS